MPVAEEAAGIGASKHGLWKWLLPPIACVAAWAALSGGSYEQRSVGAVFALTVALWITELLPLAITALLSTSLLVIVARIDEKVAFGAYGDPTILLFVGSFILAKAMEVTHLDERMAWWILSKQWATRSASRLLLTCGICSCVISLFVSNTATAAMLLPIIAKVVDSMKQTKTAFATSMLLMLTWGASVAVGFPVGTPPNLIAMQQIQTAVGVRISFVQWMIFAMPLTLILVLCCWIYLRTLDQKSHPSVTGTSEIALSKLKEIGATTRPEKVVMGCFTIALVLWVLPDGVAAVAQLWGQSNAPWITWLQKHVTPTIAALFAASLLFIFPAGTSGKRAISWRQAANIDWAVVLLFGGGIALGQAMFSSGLAKMLGDLAAQGVGAESVWAITAVSIAAAIILSELASNTAAASAMIPVAIGLAQGAGVSPIPPALGAALGASLGFMLPVSTPPNAIVYSSGQVSAGHMVRRGILIDVLGFVATLGCLRIFLPMLGLDR